MHTSNPFQTDYECDLDMTTGRAVPISVYNQQIKSLSAWCIRITAVILKNKSLLFPTDTGDRWCRCRLEDSQTEVEIVNTQKKKNYVQEGLYYEPI